MIVSEIFGPTIQGEGIYTGSPSIFIRLCGCNLRCHFAGGSCCDTPYTSISVKPEEQNKMSVEAIYKRVIEYPKEMDIVITGGEPMIQQADLHVLVEWLVIRGHRVTIETNGTIKPEYPFTGVFWSISPKLPSSACFGDEEEVMKRLHEKNRVNIGAIQAMVDTGYYQLKFVYSGRESLDDIKDEFLSHLTGLNQERILLMPEGATREQLERKSEETVQACIETGYRFCDRTHIRIWDSKRAV